MEGITGYITITKGSSSVQQRSIHSNSDFFSEQVIFKADHEKICFTKPTIDYRGKLMTPSLSQSGWRSFQVVYDLPLGKFQFDEDSTEDEVIIYYTD